MNLIERNIDKIKYLCNHHFVKELYVFGSGLTSDFNKKSDVDLLIKFFHIDPADYFDNYTELKDELEKLLNRSVDIVEDQAIKNPIFRNSVDKSKKLLYERTSS
ncbi:MAG: nucleotidyltransferase domain-containing protein [Bacteroidetes bacterium]|nr:nucleotidyltransferase domain-containing protein [Bacteroidota bacterium]